MIESLTVNLKSIADIMRESQDGQTKINRTLVEELVNVLAECTGFYYEIAKLLFGINQDNQQFTYAN